MPFLLKLSSEQRNAAAVWLILLIFHIVISAASYNNSAVDPYFSYYTFSLFAINSVILLITFSTFPTLRAVITAFMVFVLAFTVLYYYLAASSPVML